MGDYKLSLLLLALLAVSFLGIILPMIHGRLLPVIDDQGGDASSQLQTYIIHVKKPKGTDLLGDEELESWHKSFLPNTTLDSGEPRLVYSYHHVISGFAARLTPAELKAMEAMDGFLDADLDRELPLQPRTTYTPQLLGLSQEENGTWHESSFGQGVVIGVVDSGIPVNHASFSDKGMPPKPEWWNATCDFPNRPDFSCNRKIIGAASFHGGKRSDLPPVDRIGHGTHVASIAAGNFVDHASVLGSANGTASGMAPKAHLAIYKAHSFAANVLGAMDQAIKDGVHMLSVSQGTPEFGKVFRHPLAIGMLSVVEKGIFACTVAGNDGPEREVLDHGEPWVLTVGASTTDRRIAAVVKLGDGLEIMGETAYQPKTFNSSELFPLVYPGIDGDGDAEQCIGDSLGYIDVKGKIVLCAAGTIEDVSKGERVYREGAVGMILMDDSRGDPHAEGHVLPVSYVSFVDGEKIKNYIRSMKDSTPNATIIFKGTQFGYRPSPMLATVSSRGPSILNGGILKPDVLAPGVNILGAWHRAIGPNPSKLATSTFNLQTGTSMAAPHVSGIAALIKNKHPDWSPAYIRSAIITSATSLDLDGNPIVDENTGSPADIFGIGAGQVRPWAAMEPGLIYDLDVSDYIGYLCGLGYSDQDVTIVARREIECSTVGMIEASELNYPSIGVYLNAEQPSINVTRTVTNVGEARSAYTARIMEPTGVRVDLSAYELHFSRLGQTASFTAILSLYDLNQPPKARSAGGKLEWISDDKKYTVTSPIAINFT